MTHLTEEMTTMATSRTCVEGKHPKSNSHIVHCSNSGCRTGVLVILIGRLCSTDPCSFMKEHVISIEEVSCLAGAMHQPLTMPNQRNCVWEVVYTQWLQISHKCEGHSAVFHGTCAHFGIILHLGLKKPHGFPWASSIHNNNNNNDDDDDKNNQLDNIL